MGNSLCETSRKPQQHYYTTLNLKVSLGKYLNDTSNLLANSLLDSYPLESNYYSDSRLNQSIKPRHIQGLSEFSVVAGLTIRNHISIKRLHADCQLILSHDQHELVQRLTNS